MKPGNGALPWFIGMLCGGLAVGGAWAYVALHTAKSGNAAESQPKPRHHADDDDAPKDKGPAVTPITTVRVALAQKGSLAPVVRVFGSVIATPQAASQVSWPQEVRIKRLLVNPGQRVEPGSELVEVELSPDARSQLAIARQAVESAQAAAANTTERAKAGLATQQDMIAAGSVLAEANTKLDALTRIQLPADGLLRAGSGGVIAALAATPGQVAAPNVPLMTIEASVARLIEVGIPPEQLGSIAPGAPCTISWLGRPGGETSPAAVLTVGATIDTLTRLAPVQIKLSPGDSHAGAFLIGEQVRADFTLKAVDGLLVPRAGVLPDGNDQVVFVVESAPGAESGAVARRRAVTLAETGASAGEQALVVSGLASGDRVVVMGQTQLTDGMEVRVLEPASKPEAR